MINVAVIGIGSMGKNHARNYFELGSCKLVAVADTDEKAGREAGKKFKCKYYRSYKEMLEKEEIDAVSVVVPTSLHREVALDVIAKNKHVLLEKPIADNVQDAKEIVEAAKKQGVKLFIGHIERFNPAVKTLLQIVKKGELGKITNITATRVGVFPPRIKDANIIVDLAVHDIDIINLLVGKLPDKVYSNGGKALIQSREDYAQIFLKYGNVSGVVQVNWITPIKIRRLSVTGTKAYAELDYVKQKLTVYKSNYEKDYDTFGEFVVKFGAPEKVEVKAEVEEPLKNEIKAFLECIEKNKEPSCSGEQGLRVLEIALKALENIRS